MKAEEIKDDELEVELKKHLETPYFKNNPEYIKLWERYYLLKKDPKILFLMKHKKISQHYHWLYIELSKYFLNKNLAEVSKEILIKGLKEEAYDKNKIELELSFLPIIEKRFTEAEIFRF